VLPRGVDGDGGGAEAAVIYDRLQALLPRPLRRYLLHFEAAIEDAIGGFAVSLSEGARVLDAGAGEGRYKKWFDGRRYIGVDLGIGDAAWNYSGLDVIADLQALPFPAATFDGALNVVTLEHVREPACVLRELSRALKPSGRLLLVVPHEWEEHQQPHDYYRYTRYGIEYLLRNAGFDPISIQPVGGYFRLLSRRLLNGLQFFPGPLLLVAAIFLVPPALVAPLFDRFDDRQSFTLGFICTARKC
jgi:SAM-dependent methyltransferase